MIFNQVVSGGGSSGYSVGKTLDVNHKLMSTGSVIDLTGVEDLDSYVLSHAYYYNGGLTGVIDLSSLERISGTSALESTFEICSNITGVDASSLVTITGDTAMYKTFSGCSNLVDADLSSLESVVGMAGLSECFKGTGLTSMDLSSLTEISGNQGLQGCFSNCASLASIVLSSLSVLTGANALASCFSNDTSLTSLSFPSLTSTSFGSYTNQFNNMLYGVTGCTVHFPSNLQSVIGSWSSVTGGFNGYSTTVLFDLPATT